MYKRPHWAGPGAREPDVQPPQLVAVSLGCSASVAIAQSRIGLIEILPNSYPPKFTNSCRRPNQLRRRQVDGAPTGYTTSCATLSWAPNRGPVGLRKTLVALTRSGES